MREPARIKEICRRVRAVLSAPKAKAPDGAARIVQLKTEIASITDAIAGGMLRASPALAAMLAATEIELHRLEKDARQAVPTADVSQLLADLPAQARRAVDQLEKTLAAGDVARARGRKSATRWA
jgi:hypothetical protein